ncbi:hypothetical protein BJV78DRAFT_1191244 [Lactifluus subvellereus]|nr:hypothetical protein BJV78DRAFT_1191244 [Lactifluus subvellereus]
MSALSLPPESEAASSRPERDESSNKLFDDPDADIILRSSDSQEFRVLKLYIIKSSTALGKLIQATASNLPDDAIPTDARTPLPVVQMSDSGAILSCLLTFIFPTSPALPPTVDETMELLSVAQKYEMSSVLAHIRGSIALQDPPFIHEENAFHVYSLAQKYGLRREAAQAARITLKFTLTIENLEGKLDIMPGAYLYELWLYHHQVQSNISSDMREFRKSCARGTLNGLKCVRLTAEGIPQWLDNYICSISKTPSFFDLIGFQNALVDHVNATVNGRGDTRCSFCPCIPSQTTHAFWSALTNVVHRGMEKVGIVDMKRIA